LADPDWHPGPANPDPDPYIFQPNVKLNYTFSKKTSKYCQKNIEIMTPMTLSRKVKQYKLALLGKKVKKILIFQQV
jgi:hypothetical protein